MSMTIEIPDTLAEQIRNAAAAEGIKGQDVNHYAVARLQEVFREAAEDSGEPDDDLIAALRDGLAQADAGQLRTLGQVEETVRIRLAGHRKAAA